MSLFRPNPPRQEVQTLRAFAAFILAFAGSSPLYCAA